MHARLYEALGAQQALGLEFVQQPVSLGRSGFSAACIVLHARIGLSGPAQELLPQFAAAVFPKGQGLKGPGPEGRGLGREGHVGGARRFA